MLNAQWLETFTVLSETGHFTRAADRLGMTQPGVSQHLRKLEAQLGQPLISRHGKGFELTSAGEAVAAMGLARRAEERALREGLRADDPEAGEVVVACSGSFALLLHPVLLARMRGAPRLVLRLIATPQEDIPAGLLEGRFDLGVLGHAPTHPRLDVQRIGREELCLVLPAEAPERPLRLEDLDARGFIGHPDGFGHADELLAANFPEEFAGADRLRLRAFVNQIGQICAPVAEGIGYTLLPRSGVDAFPAREKLRVAPLPRRCHHELWLVGRRGREMPARFTSVAQDIRAVAARLDAD